MGRKAILKNLVDIVVMLKQEDDLDEKDKKRVAQMRELESLYGDEGDADEVEGLMRVRNAGRKTQQDTSRNLIDSLGQAGEKAVQQARSSQQQPPKTSPSSDYTDESALEEGHAYNRQTGKRTHGVLKVTIARTCRASCYSAPLISLARLTIHLDGVDSRLQIIEWGPEYRDPTQTRC